MRSLAVIILFLLAGCAGIADIRDETAGWSAQKLYAEAKSQMSDGNYEKAIKYFEQLEARYPYGRFAQQAQLEVAYAHFKQGEQASAAAACDRFIKLHPNHPNVDYAYYLKGLAYFNEDLGLLGSISMQDQTERDPKAARESFAALRELVTRYPQSKYSPDAAQRMSYLLNALAYNEVHVARYYYRRGAHLAAVNRAQYAIQNYPDTPAREEALFIMMKGYEAMGIKDLRDDAERVLQANFPNSELYKTGLDRQVPWYKPW